MTKYIGRQVAYGMGKETVAGTAVTASYWVRHLSGKVLDAQDTIDNESAMGVVERVNDSDVVRRWGEIELEAKVQDRSVGLFLLGAFGSVATTDNPDTDASVKNHTFNIQQSVTPTSLTFVKKSPVEDIKFALGRVGSFELTVGTSDWAKVSIGGMSKPSSSASSTVAYVEENEFTSKHITAKLASSVAGLGAASAIPVESVTLSITKELEGYYAAGDLAPNDIHATAVSVEGEITLIHENSTYEDLYQDSTPRALEFKLQNTDVTIGASANPTLTFTLPKVKFTERDRDESLDPVVRQTLTFKGFYDVSSGYMIRSVLTNTVISY